MLISTKQTVIHNQTIMVIVKDTSVFPPMLAVDWLVLDLAIDAP
jgi:hypothetical protein